MVNINIRWRADRYTSHQLRGMHAQLCGKTGYMMISPLKHTSSHVRDLWDY
jgi:hypothetical protein